LDPDRFDVVLIGIDKQGKWALRDRSNFLLNPDNPDRIELQPSSASVALLPGSSDSGLANLTESRLERPLDVVFPVLHGTYGEDGTVQGLLKLADIPFVGPSVLGSAVGMDKDVMKRLLRDDGIPIADFVSVTARQAGRVHFDDVASRLGLPLFIKPANMGSSVGISKVSSEKEFAVALDDALRFDRKVIIEEYVEGREIECAVLGNDDPAASCPGEIVPTHDFYSYEAKYLDEHGALLHIPADLDPTTSDRIREMAIRVFQVLCCEGMARIDFFLRPDGQIVVNEINTIPGFTRISMYPKLWEASGLPYGQLVERLIELAIERHRREGGLQTTV
jgi:D-alanine-D-alanine ligase